MNDYTLDQIKSMQKEATKRVREMNDRSKRVVDSANSNFKSSATDKAHPPKEERKAREEIKETVKSVNKKDELSGKKKGTLSFLNALDIKKLIGENSEQALLLLLILILLYDNSSDDYLIYALIYIML